MTRVFEKFGWPLLRLGTQAFLGTLCWLAVQANDKLDTVVKKVHEHDIRLAVIEATK
jgi:hypothetical protein